MSEQDTDTDQSGTDSVEDLEILKDVAEETRAGESTRNGNLQIAAFYQGD